MAVWRIFDVNEIVQKTKTNMMKSPEISLDSGRHPIDKGNELYMNLLR